MNDTKILNEDLGLEIFVECNECNKKTYHSILSSFEQSQGDEDFNICSKNRIIQCKGCKNISFQKTSFCSEDVDYDKNGDPIFNETEYLYPERSINRKMLDWVGFAPNEICNIYMETYKALVSGLNLLTQIGLRSIIESICKDLDIKSGTLEEKIEQLFIKKLIGEKEKEILHELRIMGNCSVHNNKNVSAEKLEHAMDVVESILRMQYISQYFIAKK